MKALVAVFSVLTMISHLSAQAAAPAPKGKAPVIHETAECRIFEANAVAITLSVGKDGNTHEAFKITDTTKVKLDGVPSFARDLRAGMMARVGYGADHITALWISAKDAPAHPHKGRLG